MTFIEQKTMWSPSPNFKKNADGTPVLNKPSVVVLHATAGKAEGALSWMCKKESGVSAHYLLAKDSRLWRLVEEKHIAFHAGDSAWNGRKWVNNFSVGIEIENANDGKDPYPPVQLGACWELVKEILGRWKLPANAITFHSLISPGRKTDPGPMFPSLEQVIKNVAVA